MLMQPFLLFLFFGLRNMIAYIYCRSRPVCPSLKIREIFIINGAYWVSHSQTSGFFRAYAVQK